ncbi:MAG: hypothetical protein C4547_01715 [Phycisphaerales bacterium]|nr:MAG: hypothetical protein C4547_01715 [Phycisphaerales bacterium]
MAWPAALSVGLASAGPAWAQVTWDGSCGDTNWHTCCNQGGGIFENNWDFGPGPSCPRPLPGPNDDVDLGGATVQVVAAAIVNVFNLSSTGIFRKLSGSPFTVGGNADLAEFTLDGGTFTVNGLLTIGGPFTWGERFGSTIVCHPDSEVTGSSTFGGGGRGLNGCTLTFRGPIDWASRGFSLTNGATLETEGAVTIRVPNDGTLITSSGLTNRWISSGPVTRRDAAGRFIVQAEFENHGGLTVQSGTFRLDGGGESTASFNVADVATLDFATLTANRTFTLQEGTSLSGAGLYQKSGLGRLVIAQGVTVSPERFELTGSAGTPVQVDGRLDIQQFEWDRGTLTGFGLTRVTGSLNMSSTGAREVDAHDLEILGSTTWSAGVISLSGDGTFINRGTLDYSGTRRQLTLSDTAQFNNASGGVLHLDASLQVTGAGGEFANSGSIDIQNLATIDVSVAVELGGTVDVAAGRLVLTGGGSADANFSIAADQDVTVPSGRLVVNEPAKFAGPGFLVIEATGVADVGGNVVADNVELAGSPASISTAGELKVQTLLRWLAGQVNGAGRMVVSGDAELSGADDKSLAVRRMDTEGAVFWNDGDLGLSEGCLWTHTGTLDIRTPVARSMSGTPVTFFDNRGTVRKSTNVLTTVSGRFGFLNSAGSVDVEQGVLRISSLGLSRARWNVTGGVLEFGPVADVSYTLQSGTSFSGNGTVRVLGSILQVAGNVAVPNPFEFLSGRIVGLGELSLANLRWTGGVMRDRGDTIVTGLAIIDGAGSKTLDNRVFSNRGRVNWNQGALVGGSAAEFFNHPGATFDVGSGSANLTFSLDPNNPTATVFNDGTLVKQIGDTTSVTFDVNVENRGTVRCMSGTLVFSQQFAMITGLLSVAPGGLVRFTNPLTVANGRIEGSRVKMARLKLSGGTVAPGLSPGVLTLEGDYEQESGGTLEIELAGRQQGTEYDHLIVTGAAMLDGTLDIRLIDGFEPQVGDTFQIMTFASNVGEFAEVITPCGFDFIVHYNPDDVTLEVTGLGLFPPGDFDGDCDVDLDDYRRWAPCMAGPNVTEPPQGCDPEDFAGADLDGDRDVDLADFDSLATVFTGP